MEIVRDAPRAPWRVRAVAVSEPGLLKVEFVDGTSGSCDLREFLQSDHCIGTMFEPLRDPAMFSRVNIALGAVSWPEGIDLPPDAMHHQIVHSGVWKLNPPEQR